MINRILSFYKKDMLVVFFSIMTILLTILFGNPILAVLIALVVVMMMMLMNEDMLNNTTYIWTGELLDKPDKYLTKSLIQLKNARHGGDNPLFVADKDNYYYYDTNYYIEV